MTGGSGHATPSSMAAAGWFAGMRVAPAQALPAFGRFIIHKKLGAGGMGEVYLAHDPQLKRQVAIKRVLRRGEVISDEERARLLLEAQMLAGFKHDNVVHVYDVSTEGDEPWIVMEFVVGRTLRAWAAEAPPRWRDALEVLLTVARAIEAAHKAGLIHRDLKPDNVMIDHNGKVIVVDFGLARAQQPAHDASEDAATLRSDPPAPRFDTAPSAHPAPTGRRSGTWAYMAPEQRRGHEPLPTVDQFAFCVMASELLHGRHPFAPWSLAPQVRRDRPRVPGWIDRVLQRGLAEKPEDRWRSMQELVDALERGRNGPRRLLVGAGILAFAVTFASTLLSGPTQVDRCEEVDAELVGIWDEETREAVRAVLVDPSSSHRRGDLARSPGEEAWTRVASTIDGYTERWLAARRGSCRRSHADPAGAREQRRAMCLEERRAELQVLIDELRIWEPTTASRAAEAAAALTSVGECDTETTSSTPKSRAVARDLWRAKYAQRLGDYATSAAIAESLERAADQTHDDDLRAEALVLRGSLLAERGQFREAEAVLSRALWLAEADRNDRLAAEAALARLEIIGCKLVHIRHAEEWLPDADARIVRAGDRRPHRLRLRRIIAEMKLHRGAYDEAIEHLRAILASLPETDDDARPERLSTIVLLIEALRRKPDPTPQWEALGLVEDAQILWNAVYGEQHVGVAQLHVLRAQVIANIPNWNRLFPEDAIRNQLTTALRIAEAGGEELLHIIGAVYNDMGNHTPIFAEGEAGRQRLQFFEQALSAWQLAYGPEHPRVAIAMANAGATLWMLNRADRAIEYLERSVAIIEETSGEDHPVHAFWLSRLGDMLVRHGRVEEGTAALERALATTERHFGANNKRVYEVTSALGHAYVVAGDLARAEATCTRSLAVLRRWESDGVAAAYPFVCFGRIDALEGRLDEALKNFQTAFRLLDPATRTLCRNYFCPGYNDFFVALATALAAHGSVAESNALMCEVTRNYVAHAVSGLLESVEFEARLQKNSRLLRRMRGSGANFCGPAVRLTTPG